MSYKEFSCVPAEVAQMTAGNVRACALPCEVVDDAECRGVCEQGAVGHEGLHTCWECENPWAGIDALPTPLCGHVTGARCMAWVLGVQCRAVCRLPLHHLTHHHCLRSVHVVPQTAGCHASATDDPFDPTDTDFEDGQAVD